MTEAWKKLGFIFTEKDNLYSVTKIKRRKDDVEISGIVFHIDDEITYELVTLSENDYEDLIQDTLTFLKRKRDLVDVMGNEWTHYENHANKVFEK
jgi:hypothetical protein